MTEQELYVQRCDPAVLDVQWIRTYMVARYAAAIGIRSDTDVYPEIRGTGKLMGKWLAGLFTASPHSAHNLWALREAEVCVIRDGNRDTYMREMDVLTATHIMLKELEANNDSQTI